MGMLQINKGPESIRCEKARNDCVGCQVPYLSSQETREAGFRLLANVWPRQIFLVRREDLAYALRKKGKDKSARLVEDLEQCKLIGINHNNCSLI